eukprot:GHVN01070976.1.p1 GENE.GHVN01070976.1~~GHVN01070976.1.p1  ORF type:complete len:1273 (-),score=450.81 GHVN01070976.1:195-3887(-)
MQADDSHLRTGLSEVSGSPQTGVTIGVGGECEGSGLNDGVDMQPLVLMRSYYPVGPIYPKPQQWHALDELARLRLQLEGTIQTDALSSTRRSSDTSDLRFASSSLTSSTSLITNAQEEDSYLPLTREEKVVQQFRKGGGRAERMKRRSQSAGGGTISGGGGTGIASTATGTGTQMSGGDEAKLESGMGGDEVKIEGGAIDVKGDTSDNPKNEYGSDANISANDGGTGTPSGPAPSSDMGSPGEVAGGGTATGRGVKTMKGYRLPSWASQQTTEPHQRVTPQYLSRPSDSSGCRVATGASEKMWEFYGDENGVRSLISSLSRRIREEALLIHELQAMINVSEVETDTPLYSLPPDLWKREGDEGEECEGTGTLSESATPLKHDSEMDVKDNGVSLSSPAAIPVSIAPVPGYPTITSLTLKQSAEQQALRLEGWRYPPAATPSPSIATWEPSIRAYELLYKSSLSRFTVYSLQYQPIPAHPISSAGRCGVCGDYITHLKSRWFHCPDCHNARRASRRWCMSDHVNKCVKGSQILTRELQVMEKLREELSQMVSEAESEVRSVNESEVRVKDEERDEGEGDESDQRQNKIDETDKTDKSGIEGEETYETGEIGQTDETGETGQTDTDTPENNKNRENGSQDDSAEVSDVVGESSGVVGERSENVGVEKVGVRLSLLRRSIDLLLDGDCVDGDLPTTRGSSGANSSSTSLGKGCQLSKGRGRGRGVGRKRGGGRVGGGGGEDEKGEFEVGEESEVEVESCHLDSCCNIAMVTRNQGDVSVSSSPLPSAMCDEGAARQTNEHASHPHSPSPSVQTNHSKSPIIANDENNLTHLTSLTPLTHLTHTERGDSVVDPVLSRLKSQLLDIERAADKLSAKREAWKGYRDVWMQQVRIARSVRSIFIDKVPPLDQSPSPTGRNPSPPERGDQRSGIPTPVEGDEAHLISEREEESVPVPASDTLVDNSEVRDGCEGDESTEIAEREEHDEEGAECTGMTEDLPPRTAGGTGTGRRSSGRSRFASSPNSLTPASGGHSTTSSLAPTSSPITSLDATPTPINSHAAEGTGSKRGVKGKQSDKAILRTTFLFFQGPAPDGRRLAVGLSELTYFMASHLDLRYSVLRFPYRLMAIDDGWSRIHTKAHLALCMYSLDQALPYTGISSTCTGVQDQAHHANEVDKAAEVLKPTYIASTLLNEKKEVPGVPAWVTSEVSQLFELHTDRSKKARVVNKEATGGGVGGK